MSKTAILILLFFAGSIMVKAQPVKQHGNLSVKGVNLVDQQGNPVMLVGVSYGWHNWWPRFYNKESVRWLATDWKCSVVRAAMGVEPAGGYLDSAGWSKEKTEAVIEGAIENGIYVIIDWHSHGVQTRAAVQFFEEMAKKYGHYPNIIYEIFNEPVNDSWDVIKSYSTEVIKAIRKYDPDNIILVGCPHWDQDIHLVADSPVKGFANLMYTVHFYADTHGQELRDRSDYALRKGIPLFVSESAGMAASGNGPINYAEWQKWIDWMNMNRISFVMWSISDKDESCSMLKTSAASEGNWKDSDMKESGIKTKELVRSYQK